MLTERINEFKPRSCKEIKQVKPDSESGLYTIFGQNMQPYTVFCEMSTANGGWTLVASIHENDMSGKCTAGDRWSSEHGYNANNHHGDGNWDTENTFGNVNVSTSDDYKNRAYYELQSDDVMVLQVPNDAPVSQLLTSAYFQYYTSNAFLKQHGGKILYIYVYIYTDFNIGSRYSTLP